MVWRGCQSYRRGSNAQVQLVTSLVKLEEIEPEAVREVYRLLVDSAAGIRHAAAGLVAGLLEDQGARFLVSQQPKVPPRAAPVPPIHQPLILCFPFCVCAHVNWDRGGVGYVLFSFWCTLTTP